VLSMETVAGGGKVIGPMFSGSKQAISETRPVPSVPGTSKRSPQSRCQGADKESG
jgi:hypothetical protein